MIRFTKNRPESIGELRRHAANDRSERDIWKCRAARLQAELAALRAYMAEHAPMELRAFDVRAK